MSTDQLRLIPTQQASSGSRRSGSWRLDDETIAAGRRGVAEARAVLLRLRTDEGHRDAA